MSTPRLPEVVDFPRYSNADIGWYMRMPTDPPQVDLEVEMLPQLCVEEGATLKQALPVIVNVSTDMDR